MFLFKAQPPANDKFKVTTLVTVFFFFSKVMNETEQSRFLFRILVKLIKKCLSALSAAKIHVLTKKNITQTMGRISYIKVKFIKRKFRSIITRIH